MKSTRAAISIFLIIVLFATTLLGGLFIDATRILLARRYVRNAINSAARSALSYFDENLSSEYGLFAVDGETAEQAFRHYFQTNLRLAGNEGFDILRMETRDSDLKVTTAAPITNQDELLEAMSEYSKYRVVVNTSIGVIEKIKGLFGGDGTSQKVFNAADTGKDAMEQLKSDALEFSNKARALISSGIRTNTDRAKNTISNMLSSGSTTMPTDEELGFDDIEGELEAAKEASGKIETSREEFDQISAEEAQKLEDVKTGSASYWDEESGSWRSEQGDASTSGQDDGIRSDVPSVSQAAEEEKSEVDKKIQETEARFETNKAEIRTKSAQAVEHNKQIEKLTATVDTLTATVTTLRSDLRALEQARLEDPFGFSFEEYTQTAEIRQLRELVAQYDEKKTALEELRRTGASQEQIADAQTQLSQAEDAVRQFLEEMESPPKTTYDEEIQKVQDKLTAAEAELKAAEDALAAEKQARDKVVGELQTLYDGIAAEESSFDGLSVPESISGEDRAKMDEDGASFLSSMTSAFSQLSTEFGKRASDVTATDGYAEFSFSLGSLVDDLWGTIERLLEICDGLITLVSDPEAAGEAMLFTDYVFGNFTFLTTQTIRDSRHFQVAEIEYILQGNDSQAKCVTSTLTEITMLRLLINWIDYMTTTHSPEIISRMVIALGRAAIRTVQDMASMIFTLDSDETASCALSPSFSKVRLTYSDHLRLAMLLRAIGDSGRESMMDRVLLMMEDTYEVQGWGELSTRQTRVQAEVTVEVDLVMLTLPMFEHVLPPDNQILQDGKFLIHETVDLGY